MLKVEQGSHWVNLHGKRRVGGGLGCTLIGKSKQRKQRPALRKNADPPNQNAAGDEMDLPQQQPKITSGRSSLTAI